MLIVIHMLIRFDSEPICPWLHAPNQSDFGGHHVNWVGLIGNLTTVYRKTVNRFFPVCGRVCLSVCSSLSLK